MLDLPAFWDAHDHGRGVSPVAYGAHDQALELWIPALSLHPAADPYTVAAAAFCRLARGGYAKVAHFHVTQDVARLAEEARAVARAAADVGIKIEFIVPLRDRNRLVLGDDQAFLAALPAEDRRQIEARWLSPVPSPEAQAALVEEIAEALDRPGFEVQYGPVAPHWCSDRLLELVARGRRRVHTHLLETRRQRDWADRSYPRGWLAHLDALGLLSPQLTVAHGVWLRQDEIRLLAERGVTLVTNPSSNLRLRSGTAPVPDFLAAGLTVRVGLDGMGFDDEPDALQELRLLRLLHDLPADQALALSTGSTGDRVLLDLPTDLEQALARGHRGHVRRLVVAGRTVIEDGAVVGMDEAALNAALPDPTPSPAAHALVERFQGHLRRYYGFA